MFFNSFAWLMSIHPPNFLLWAICFCDRCPLLWTGWPLRTLDHHSTPHFSVEGITDQESLAKTMECFTLPLIKPKRSMTCFPLRLNAIIISDSKRSNIQRLILLAWSSARITTLYNWWHVESEGTIGNCSWEVLRANGYSRLRTPSRDGHSTQFALRNKLPRNSTFYEI